MERVQSLPRIPARARETHKGTYGRVLIVAGSPGMPGAAVLAARAALRSGAGLVTAAIPASLSTVVGAASPEATQILLPEPTAAGDDSSYREHLTAALGAKLIGFDAGAVGPGIGTGSSVRVLLGAVLARLRAPTVIDADALNLVASEPAFAAVAFEKRVWTPHPGEFERLTGEKPRGDEERINASRRFAARCGGVVVLKGHHTVVLEDDRYYLNETGNPGMATGGTGDVLTGVIAALLGQGLAPFDAASLGVHVHGRAGDLAAAALGETSLIAGDVIQCLPQAFLEHARAEI